MEGRCKLRAGTEGHSRSGFCVGPGGGLGSARERAKKTREPRGFRGFPSPNFPCFPAPQHRMPFLIAHLRAVGRLADTRAGVPRTQNAAPKTSATIGIQWSFGTEERISWPRAVKRESAGSDLRADFLHEAAISLRSRPSSLSIETPNVPSWCTRGENTSTHRLPRRCTQTATLRAFACSKTAAFLTLGVGLPAPGDRHARVSGRRFIREGDFEGPPRALSQLSAVLREALAGTLRERDR